MIESIFAQNRKVPQLGVLVFRGGQEDGKTLVLPDGVTMIGRGPLNDINLDSETGVSRQHAGILKDERGFWVADLGSRNGTFVNGERVGNDPRLLRNFDRIDIGGVISGTQWVFLEEAASEKIDLSQLA